MTTHPCSVRHKSWRTIAKCLWSDANWVSGEGCYALVAACRGTTVTLWTSRIQAEASKRAIDSTACGGGCTRQHEIVELSMSSSHRA